MSGLLIAGAGDADGLGRVTQALRDWLFGLALPFSPLCGPDCQGLCPDCGIPMATAEPGHRHEKIDPRWAKLASLLETDDK